MANNPYQDSDPAALSYLTRGGLDNLRMRLPGIPNEENDQVAQQTMLRQRQLGLSPDPGQTPDGTAQGQYAQVAPIDFNRIRQLNDQSAIMQGLSSMRAIPTIGNLNPQPVGDNILTAFVKAKNDSEKNLMMQQQQQQQANIDLYNRHLEQSQNQGKQYADIGASGDRNLAQAGLDEKARESDAKIKALTDLLTLKQQEQDKLAGVRDNRAAAGQGIRQGQLEERSARDTGKLNTQNEALTSLVGAADAASAGIAKPSAYSSVQNKVSQIPIVGRTASSALGGLLGKDLTQRQEVAAYNSRLMTLGPVLGQLGVSAQPIDEHDTQASAAAKIKTLRDATANALKGNMHTTSGVSQSAPSGTMAPINLPPPPGGLWPTQ